MLNAAPNEQLDLSFAVQPEVAFPTVSEIRKKEVEEEERCKRISAALAKRKGEIEERRRAWRAKKANVEKTQYDEDYYKILRCLDEQNSAEPLPNAFDVKIDNSVWKSEARRVAEIP